MTSKSQVGQLHIRLEEHRRVPAQRRVDAGLKARPEIKLLDPQRFHHLGAAGERWEAWGEGC